MKQSIYWALAFWTVAVQPALCWPVAYPTGTTLYAPEKAYNGYTLFTAMGIKNRSAYLINMNGEVVHEWKLSWNSTARLLSNGNLLVVGFDMKTPPGFRPGLPPFSMGGAAGVLQEVTWDGDVIFTYSDMNMHHDAVKLDNGNYMYLAWEKVPPALQKKVRGGIENTEFRGVTRTTEKPTPEEMKRMDKVMFNDVLVEINPQKKVVWGWSANKHLDPGIDLIGQVYTREEWCHANCLNVMKNGNILLTSRSLDSILIIDKSTKKVLFRWGSMIDLNKENGQVERKEELQDLIDKSANTRTLSGPHGADEVPSGVPGAGHIICYDNGVVERGPVRASRAIELDPATGDIVWSSSTFVDGLPVPFGRKHFSEFLGSAQKLPNGNVLICEGLNGQFFQVTRDLKEVWEYVNPFSSDPRFNGATQKAICYPPDYCPQFKSLRPAKGPPVVLVGSVTASHETSRPSSRVAQSTPSVVNTTVLVAAAALIAFVLGWKLCSARARNWAAASKAHRAKTRS